MEILVQYLFCSGRRITSKGQKDLDQIAGQVIYSSGPPFCVSDCSACSSHTGYLRQEEVARK